MQSESTVIDRSKSYGMKRRDMFTETFEVTISNAPGCFYIQHKFIGTAGPKELTKGKNNYDPQEEADAAGGNRCGEPQPTHHSDQVGPVAIEVS